ncbi:signal peptidase II [Nanoarchaeota archaeon]
MATGRWLLKWQHAIALLCITIAIVAVDRITKFYIEELLYISESIPVIPNIFSITRINNTGAAFGLMKGYNILFFIAALAVFVLFIMYYKEIVKDNYLMITASFILSGTIGNTLDRLYFGYVVDYLNLSFWPTFNLSDVFLTIGTIMLIWYMWGLKQPEKKGQRWYDRY